MKSLQALNRNLVYFIVALVVGGAIYLSRPTMPVTPHGIFLPSTDTKYTPRAPTDVQAYTKLPSGSKIIGNVRVELHFNHDTDSAQNAVLNYAESLAAEGGANGLVIDTFFGTPQAGLEQRYIFIGKAILTK